MYVGTCYGQCLVPVEKHAKRGWLYMCYAQLLLCTHTLPEGMRHAVHQTRAAWCLLHMIFTPPVSQKRKKRAYAATQGVGSIARKKTHTHTYRSVFYTFRPETGLRSTTRPPPHFSRVAAHTERAHIWRPCCAPPVPPSPRLGSCFAVPSRPPATILVTQLSTQ